MKLNKTITAAALLGVFRANAFKHHARQENHNSQVWRFQIPSMLL